MKISEGISQIIIAVGGGSLSADTNVQRQEVKTLLGVVIAHYKKVDTDEREIKFLRKARLAMSSLANFSHNLTNNYDFTVTYKLTPDYDSEREEYYVDLPVSVNNAIGKIGIKGIESVKEGIPVHVASSRMEMSGLKDVLDVYGYYDKNGDTKDERVYVVGLGTPACAILLRLIPEFSDIDEDQSIPVNEGFHKYIIEDCVEFFRKQKFITADNFIDSLDVNERNEVQNNRTNRQGDPQQ